MKKVFIGLLIVAITLMSVAIIACDSEEPESTSTPIPTDAATTDAATVETPVDGATATPVSDGDQIPGPTATEIPTEFFLQVTNPEDGSEVTAETIQVSGNTIPDAVVSIWINEDIEVADVDEDGNFSITVTLEEGPNIIEVVASDTEGGEELSQIAVTYIP